MTTNSERSGASTSPLSSAERQAAFKTRHREAGGGRLDVAVSAHAEAALGRLAVHYGLTKRYMLERLIGEAESAVVDELHGDGQKLYYAKIPVTR